MGIGAASILSNPLLLQQASDDPQTSIGRVPFVLTEDQSEDGQAAQP
jgi:hypothetical protein